MYLLQDSFIFFPTQLSQYYEFKYFENTEERFYDIDANTRVHALYFKVNQPKGVVLFFHGNARSLDDWGFVATDFTQHGYEVLIPDYRTYGKSIGKLSEKALHEDALLMYNDLRKQYDESKIIVFGRSLGTGIATELANKMNPKMLILETPYLSLPKMASRKMPFLPVSLLMKYTLDNEYKITQVDCPIHIFHGTDDLLVPYEHGLALAKIIGIPNVLTTIEGGGHNNLSEFEEYREKLADLLN